MVACCRLQSAEFFDPRILRALEAAEWCADDPQAEAAANTVWHELVTSLHPRLPQSGPEGELARVVSDAWQLLEEWWDGVQYTNTRHAIAHAVYMCLRDKPGRVFTGGDGNAAECCARAIDSAASLLLGTTPEEVEEGGQETEPGIRRAIANILRDLFGNPFRPAPSLAPAVLTWDGGTIPKLAAAVYDERAFDRLPVLADALEDAGCTDADILGHCRGGGEHVRGCWAVDLVLGKG
jgi:hypothetical protein